MYSSDRDSDNASTDHDEENISNGTIEDVRDGDVTDEDDGVASGEEVERGNAVEIGEVVECWKALLEKPWAEVSYWVEGFNKARRDEILPSSLLQSAIQH